MNIGTNRRLPFWAILTLVAVLALAIAVPSFADDITGSATVTGGTLTMSAADNPAFPETILNGTDQTQNDSINISVSDLTGTGSGWNLQITSTTFTNGGGKTLANNAMSITGASAACATGTCTDPTNGTGYPLTVPADATAPTAVKFFSAAADTGMGDFTVSPSLQLSIPADTYAGTYNSTVTITSSSGP